MLEFYSIFSSSTCSHVEGDLLDDAETNNLGKVNTQFLACTASL